MIDPKAIDPTTRDLARVPRQQTSRPEPDATATSVAAPARHRLPAPGGSRLPALGRGLAALTIGLTLVLTACADTDGATTNLAEARAVPSLQQALDVMLRAPDEGAAERFLASLPTPRDRDARAIVNRHDPSVTDELAWLRFDGMSIAVYHANATGDRFPVAVTLDAAGRSSANGLRVGLDRAGVRAVLGAPTSTADGAGHGAADGAGTWHYDVFEARSAPYAVGITFVDDTVAEITWSAYLD